MTSAWTKIASPVFELRCLEALRALANPSERPEIEARLGDLVAGTLGVYQDPVQTESMVSGLGEPDLQQPPLPADQVAAIPNEVILLADEYLRSRGELAPRPRRHPFIRTRLSMRSLNCYTN